MGILDDAIREHLDLKRSRGADPSEVTRQEQEALGPVRREPPAAEPALDAELPAEAAAEPAPPEPVLPEPAPEDVVAAEEPLTVAEPFEPEPAPPTRSVAPPAQQTEEWGFDEVEEAAPAAEPPVEEDVLEETPEFLQETPEHDRLWFEQKPPRDFDFDA